MILLFFLVLSFILVGCGDVNKLSHDYYELNERDVLFSHTEYREEGSPTLVISTVDTLPKVEPFWSIDSLDTLSFIRNGEDFYELSNLPDFSIIEHINPTHHLDGKPTTYYNIVLGHDHKTGYDTILCVTKPIYHHTKGEFVDYYTSDWDKDSLTLLEDNLRGARIATYGVRNPNNNVYVSHYTFYGKEIWFYSNVNNSYRLTPRKDDEKIIGKI